MWIIPKKSAILITLTLIGRMGMDSFEVTLGDAIFSVELRSMSQNSSNIEIDLPHFHIDNELHVVLDGAATMHLDGKDIPTKAGDIYIVPPNVCHYYEDYTDSFNKISCLFTLSKNRETVKSYSEYDYYSKIFGSVDKCVFLSDSSTMDIAERLFALEYSEATEHIYKALYALLFISVAAPIEKQLFNDVKEHCSECADTKESNAQKKMIEMFLYKRYGEKVTIEDLARTIYRSVPQTHRIIKKYFGDTFKSILTKQRMEQARMMLGRSGVSIAEIAAASGYSSYGGFLAAFKRYASMTPEEYRSSFSGGEDSRI